VTREILGDNACREQRVESSARFLLGSALTPSVTTAFRQLPRCLYSRPLSSGPSTAEVIGLPVEDSPRRHM